MSEEKKQSLFRKEALDQVSSPEEYDHYLQVTGPAIWMTLAALVILVLGAFYWAATARLDTVVQVPVIAEEEQVICMIPEDAVEDMDIEMDKVKIADKEYALIDLDRVPEVLDRETAQALHMAGGIPEGTVVHVFGLDADLPQGVYGGKIQMQSMIPLKFITN